MTVRPAGCRAEVVPSPSHLAWWPAPGTAEDDRWAAETLDVVRRVARTQGFKLYGNRRGLEEAFDDLESWLTTDALEFRDKYVPPEPDARASGVLEVWLKVLHTTLTRSATWHFRHVYRRGLSDRELWASVLFEDSTDRQLRGGDADGQGSTVGELGGPLWPPSAELASPDVQLVHLDELLSVLLTRYGIRVRHATVDIVLRLLDQLAPRPGAGQCVVWGCGRPPERGRVTAGGMCTPHREERRYVGASECSVDGCERPVKAKGVCRLHRQRQLRAEADPCTVAGCQKPQASRGLCSSHYWRARKDGDLRKLPEAVPAWQKVCIVAGCEETQKARGLCSVHYRRALDAEAEPCIEDGCGRPLFARGRCRRHYRRVRAAEKAAEAAQK